MGLVIDYKRWAIKQRIASLEKAIRRFPNSTETPRRQEELSNLRLDLENIE